jgi:serine/threonine protein kinase
MYMNEVFQDYRIVEQIVAKKYSSLYRAQLLTDPAVQVIMKVFTSSRLHTEQESARFLHEAAFLKQLQHPHILSLVDAGVAREHPYTINPYLSAGSLRSHLNDHQLSRRDALQLLEWIGEALAYAHEWEVIHGNLKPENILFDMQGHAVLTDFSLPDTIDMHQPGYRPDVRSALYMAPEQFSGNASEASDQYALGCLAYELLTGQVPFAGAAFSTISAKHIKELPSPLSQYVPDIPGDLEHAVLKALEKDPQQRYASVALFLQALTAISHAYSTSTFELPVPEAEDMQAMVTEAETAPIEEVVTSPPPITPISPTHPVSIQWREHSAAAFATSQTVPVAPIALMSSLTAHLPAVVSFVQTRVTGTLTGKMPIPFTQRSTQRWIALVAAFCVFLLSVTVITSLSHTTNTSALTRKAGASPIALADTPTPMSQSTLFQPLSTPTPMPTSASTPNPPQATTPTQPQGPAPTLPLPPGSNPTTFIPPANPTPAPTHQPAPTPQPTPTPKPTPQPTPTPKPTPKPTPTPLPQPTPTPTPLPQPTPTPKPTATSTPTPTPGPTATAAAAVIS